MKTTVDGRPCLDFGVALAGAVSGGAYTAGALDFIVQALEAWRVAEANQAPQHAVNLSVIAGTSSGALNAVILASALKYDFAPALADDAQAAANPLFDSWVNMTGITDLLAGHDVKTNGVQSLFDPTRLNEATRKAIQFGADQTAQRPWLAEPLRVCLRVSSLPGVAFGPGAGQRGTRRSHLHADVLRFAVTGLGGRPGSAADPTCDERQLSAPSHPHDKLQDWESLAVGALASAAFPFLLPARWLERPAADYEQLPSLLPEGPNAPPRVLALQPDTSLTRPTVRFQAVDGGACSGASPVDLVRDVLTGRDPRVRWSRDSDVSPYALLEIDPVAVGAPAKPPSKDGVCSSLGAFITMISGQLLFRREEVAIVQTETATSRFLLAPAGYGRQGCGTAGAFLGGLGGYLSRRFRHHDFLLGRRDAQNFLANDFVLPATHPLFGNWADSHRALYANAKGDLPIIPLMNSLRPVGAYALALPEWPWGAADMTGFRPALARRLRVLTNALALPWWLRLLLWPLLVGVRGLLTWLGVRLVNGALREHDIG